ncbi:MAG: TRAM domain-containing protein [Nitrospinae bacterium]|nr:TRAM domain-containing protein [Nitrospinota bacterium]
MNEPTPKMPVETIPVNKKESSSRLGLILGALFIILCGILGAALAEALGVANRAAGLAGGALSGVLLLVLAKELGKLKVGVLAGGAAGLLFGLLAALLLCALIGEAFPQNVRPLAGAFIGLLFSCMGVFLGSVAGSLYSPSLPAKGKDASAKKNHHAKILDTSVIIDGRIADICEAGFVEGPMVVPQFVLKELQQIADSSDSLKRNRGRRGLDVLQRIQQNQDLDIDIIETDFPRVKEVDTKLVLLGKEICGKVMTNDFNLNKVAELQGVRVLNINELANAVKPVVLPGEDMSVFVIKEGKEHNQGVGYLDDGTMVVVDNAKNRIGDQIPVSVTSVLQTTAGRMIFTKIRDEAEISQTGA